MQSIRLFEWGMYFVIAERDTTRNLLDVDNTYNYLSNGPGTKALEPSTIVKARSLDIFFFLV